MLAVALLAVAAVSCAKVEVTPVENDNPRIAFNAVISKKANPDPVAKAVEAIDGVVYPTDKEFRSIVYYNNDNLIDAGGNKDTRAAAIEWIPDSPVKYNPANGFWTAVDRTGVEQEYYWPYGGYLTFMAYSPASVRSAANITMNNTDGIRAAWDTEAEEMKGVDFMIADVKTNMTANEQNGGYTGAPIVFRHLLSSIMVSGKTEGNVTGNVKIVIKSLALQNVFTTGKFYATFEGDENADKWGALSFMWQEQADALDNIYLYDSTEGQTLKWNEFSQIGETYIAIPQKLDSEDRWPAGVSGKDFWINLQVTFDTYNRTGTDANGAATYNSTPDNTETKTIRIDQIHGPNWERGMRYHYKLSFGEHKPIKFEGIAEDWGPTPDNEILPEAPELNENENEE